MWSTDTQAALFAPPLVTCCLALPQIAATSHYMQSKVDVPAHRLRLIFGINVTWHAGGPPGKRPA